MGITLRSENMDADMSYGGFNRLRMRVSAMLSDEWAEFYGRVMCQCWGDDERWAYNRELNERADAEPKRRRRVVDFLYAPDCDGRLGRRGCKAVARLMDEHADEWRGSAETFSHATDRRFGLAEFREMLQDGIETGKGIRWR